MRGVGLGLGCAALTICALLAACSSSAPVGTSPPPASRASTGPSQSSPQPSATPTTAPRASLAGCPAARPESARPVFARPGGEPDDLVAATDGSLWVSEVNDGVILHLAPDGHVLGRLADPAGPEGMVLLDDGRLIVANQKTNQIVAFDAARGGAPQTLATLPNSTGALGVDGIGFDRSAGRLLVPNSPEGSLLAISPRDGSMTTLATGLGRAVGADVGPDGAIYVTAEESAGLLRVPSGGGPGQRVGSLSQLDDVISSGGLLYVAAIAGRVDAVDPATGDARPLMTGGSEIQGLARLADGRFAAVDEITRVIVTVDPCH